MKKEEMKAAITANFENHEFNEAMELNKDLFQEYEKVAGKRSLASLITYWKKKNVSPAPAEEPTKQEEITATESQGETPKEGVEVKTGIIDEEKAKAIIESSNAGLYCIIKEEFKQVSDTERFVQTTMIVKPDGAGWDTYKDVVAKLGGKKGVSKRKVGSLWRSNCGIPVGEEITTWNIWKIGDALKRYAFRNNESALRKVTTVL